MNHKITLAAAASVALLLGGCASSGMSPRETQGRDVTAYMGAIELRPQSSVLDDVGSNPDAPAAAPMRLPASIAVAQVGYVAPPDEMLERLEAEPALFRDVQPINGTTPLRQYSSQDEVGNHLQQMLGVARDVGADYLVVYGGTIDQFERSEPWKVLDLAIVPAFVLPSTTLKAEARSNAFVLDTTSGRPVATASAAADDSRGATSLGRKGAGLNQMRDLRDETLDELSVRLIERFRKAADAAPRAALRDGAAAGMIAGHADGLR